MVAKIFRDPSEDRASYFKDVEMQMQAKEIADRFNRRNPPKKVTPSTPQHESSTNVT